MRSRGGFPAPIGTLSAAPLPMKPGSAGQRPIGAGSAAADTGETAERTGENLVNGRRQRTDVEIRAVVFKCKPAQGFMYVDGPYYGARLIHLFWGRDYGND